MLDLNSLLIGSEDPKRLAAFYAAVLQADKPGWEGGDFVGYRAGSTYLMIGPHSEVHGSNTQPGRLIFNFESATFDEEVQRIKAIAGIKVVQEPYSPGENPSMKLATFADPDGNYFQLATPMQ